MASAKTSKIEKSTEVTSKPASTPQNIAVKEPEEDEDDWTEMNCWWRHLEERVLASIREVNKFVRTQTTLSKEYLKY